MRRRDFLLAAAPLAAHAAAWEHPIRSKTLDGWRQTGSASWRNERGTIIGTQGPGGSAGDLLTEGKWKDFELECEWRMRFPGNSGIWFRYTGPQAAYQADILEEASYPGVLSGSVYCMGKAFIAQNRDARSVRKDGWNRMRVMARGDHLTVWMNGRQVVDLRDNTFNQAGSIGIQVHPGKNYEGMEIRVRKLRVRAL